VSINLAGYVTGFGSFPDVLNGGWTAVGKRAAGRLRYPHSSRNWGCFIGWLAREGWVRNLMMNTKTIETVPNGI